MEIYIDKCQKNYTLFFLILEIIDKIIYYDELAKFI